MNKKEKTRNDIESLAKEHNNANIIFVKQFIWNYLLISVGLVITIFIACFSVYTNCVFAFLLYIPFPILLIWFTKFIADTITNASRQGIKKGWVITISIFLYIFKYIVVIIPIVIGSLVNLYVDSNLFNLFSLITITLIYPTSSLLSRIKKEKKQETNTFKRSEVYYLVLTGIFMALTIVAKLIFHFIPGINGYGIEFHLIIYVYAMMLINNRKWQWTFGLLTPWVILMVPPSVINPWQFLMEYILALYIFLSFIYFDLIIKLINKTTKSSKLSMLFQMLVFGLMIVIAIFTKLAIHTIAGKLWWTPSDTWYSSFMFNMPIYITTLGVILPIGLVVYPSLIQFRGR